MKHITEGQAWNDYHKRKGKPRPPLRSLKELSEELGVHVGTISGKLKMEGAPKARLSRGLNNSAKNAYFEPKEFYLWWEKVKENKNV